MNYILYILFIYNIYYILYTQTWLTISRRFKHAHSFICPCYCAIFQLTKTIVLLVYYVIMMKAHVLRQEVMLCWMMCSLMYNFAIFRYVGCGPPFVHRHQTPYILQVDIALSLLESLHWQNHEMVNWSQFKNGKTHSLKWIKSGGKFRTESGTTGLLLLKEII